MKICIKCGLLFDETNNSHKYCFDCAYIMKKEQDKIKDEKRNYGSNYNRTLGNPKQDEKILEFLREKRKKEDKKYNR